MKKNEFEEKGYHFSKCLYHALTKGVEDYAKDTTRRSKFLSENQHLISGVMLVGIFSYLESTLGKNWIDRCGGRQKRELECLRFVRNAFVHSNGNIRDLNSYTTDLENDLRLFIDDLNAGKVEDGKGNTYPVYMTIDSDGLVELNEHALNIFRSLCKAISH